LLEADSWVVVQWKEFLSKRISQLGFSKAFKVYKQIGEGSSANVYWAKRLSDNKHVAVKAMSK
jgi:serine/threonine protein kinase